jgi:hypothetical protein
MRNLDDIFARLGGSAFRRRFRLGDKERAYFDERGLATILSHGRDFIAKRLAPAAPVNDGNRRRGEGTRCSSHSTRPPPAAARASPSGTASRRVMPFRPRSRIM